MGRWPRGGQGAPNTGGTGAATGQSNTGGGAGGGSTPQSGGSGVVILRIAAGDYTGTTTGSPTVTDDGSFKVVKFTGSGSIEM